MPRKYKVTRRPSRATRRTRALRVNAGFRRQPRRRRGRTLAIYKNPRAPLTIPLKCGYDYAVVGTGAASLDFDDTLGFHRMPAAWFNRYQPIFDYVRINKVRIEINVGYNIGQPGIGTHPSLFRLWYKKALSTAETPPDSITEWLNDQKASRKTFAADKNSVNLYFTPSYETTVQPLNVANTQLRLLYKQWQTIQTTPGAMTPHIGMLAQMTRLDGGPITNAMSFRVNVTLYCELKGVKEL